MLKNPQDLKKSVETPVSYTHLDVYKRQVHTAHQDDLTRCNLHGLVARAAGQEGTDHPRAARDQIDNLYERRGRALRAIATHNQNAVIRQ